MSESGSSSNKMSILNGRMSHLCAVINNQMFMVGGYHKGEVNERFKDRDVTVSMTDVNIYSIRDGTWRRVKASGDIPNRGSGMCTASYKHFIYAFGGLTINNSRMREFSNTLHELNTETMTWRLLKPHRGTASTGFPDRPSIRDKAAMVHYNGGLWVFAGWGSRIDRTQINSQFVPDQSHDFVGWNNELWRFDLSTQQWSAPDCAGAPPSPRAAHTMTMCGKHRAVVFGGRTKEGRVDELYILHLDKKQWEGPIDTGPGPEPRSLHSCTRVQNGKVLLLGGMNSEGDSVRAQWILQTKPTPSWQQVRLVGEEDCARTWHTTVAHPISHDCTGLLVFGGSPDNIWQPKHKYWANMTRFTYGVKPLYDLCLDFISSEGSCNPDHTDLINDIAAMKQVHASAKRSHLDTESIPIYDMDSIRPTSAS